MSIFNFSKTKNLWKNVFYWLQRNLHSAKLLFVYLFFEVRLENSLSLYLHTKKVSKFRKKCRICWFASNLFKREAPHTHIIKINFISPVNICYRKCRLSLLEFIARGWFIILNVIEKVYTWSFSDKLLNLVFVLVVLVYEFLHFTVDVCDGNNDNILYLFDRKRFNCELIKIEIGLKY